MSGDDEGFFQNNELCSDWMIVGTEDHQLTTGRKKNTLGMPVHPTVVWVI